MTTIIEEFVQKALSSERQFTINKGDRNMFFTKVSIGSGECIFGEYSYNNVNFISSLDLKLRHYAIVSDGNVYIMDRYNLDLSNEYEFTGNVYNFYKQTKIINHEINEKMFSLFYNSLPTRELTEEELERANKQSRDILLTKNGNIEQPIIEDLVNEQVTANILYKLVNFYDYVYSCFEEKKEYYITIKSINHKIAELIQMHTGVNAWESKLNNALRALEKAKTVVVEFLYDGKLIEDKIEIDIILRKLNHKDYFSSWDFSTGKQGELLLKYLNKEKWKVRLTCEHINKISYGRKDIYIK